MYSTEPKPELSYCIYGLSPLYSAVVHPNDNALLTATVILFPAQFRCTDDKRSLLTKAKQLHPEENRWASYLVSASRSFSVQWNMKSDGYRSLDSIRRLAKGLFCFIIVELSPEKFFSPPLSTMPTTAIERFIRISALVHHPDSSFGNQVNKHEV